MPRCLFCLQEKRADIAEFTDEHVFPASLGGELVVKHGSCRACNNGMSKFEQALASELTPIRMLLQIPDRYGKVPRTPARILTPTEVHDGWVGGDGKVVVRRQVTQEVSEEGKCVIVHRFTTDAQKERLRDDAKRKGLRFIETDPGNPVMAEVHIEGNFMSVGSMDGLRSVAKIAYLGLAHFVGATIVTGDAFCDVRRFISEGAPLGVARIFVNKRYLEANRQGPHQHLISIAARRDQQQVNAIVRLFGELTYFVVLSDNYDGADFCKTLVYDAYRGEENGILFGHLQAELIHIDDVSNSEDTEWDDLKCFGENFCGFLVRTMEVSESKKVNTRAEDGLG